MSTDFSVKPVGAPAARPANGAVATELPVTQSVSAAAAGAGVELSQHRRAYFRALNLTRRVPTRLVVTDRTV
jgi:hypothetical protein